MSTRPWLVIERVKTATIPEAAALDLINDIDDAVRRRDVVMLRRFAAEAQASGLDQESSRANELAALMSKADRDELTRIKSALQPPRPTTAQLAAEFDRQWMAGSGARFSRTTSEADEHQRAEIANAALASKQRKLEESRARHVNEEPPERPWWR